MSDDYRRFDREWGVDKHMQALQPLNMHTCSHHNPALSYIPLQVLASTYLVVRRPASADLQVSCSIWH